MSWLLAPIYDPFMRSAEEACLRDWRRALLAEAEGEVLDVGAGTGANLPFYPPSVEHVVAAEPDPGMAKRLRTKLAASRDRRVEVFDAGAERMPFADASFDTVVSTLVLCTVPDADAALAEIRRVLRPGGKLLFIEHVAADDRPSRLRWQERVEPIWKHLAGGCHLTRRTDQAIERAGFEIQRLERESMRKAMVLARTSVRGVARR